MIFPPLVYARNSFIRTPIIPKRGGFVIQRHNEPRYLDEELLSTVCSNVKGEPVLQDLSREQLKRGANKAKSWSFFHMDSANTNDRHFLILGSAPNVKSCKNQGPQSLVLKESSRHWTRNIHIPNIQHNGKNGRRMLEISRADRIKKRKYLRQLPFP